MSRTPSAWNFATKLGPRWVRVHLRDGTIIGGVFEDGSFADDSGEVAAFEDLKDIYLEQVYNLTEDGDFGEPVTNTAGIWIAHDMISHVMFFKREQNGGPGGETNDASSTAEA